VMLDHMLRIVRHGIVLFSEFWPLVGTPAIAFGRTHTAHGNAAVSRASAIRSKKFRNLLTSIVFIRLAAGFRRPAGIGNVRSSTEPRDKSKKIPPPTPLMTTQAGMSARQHASGNCRVRGYE
jgi:hypothetical protein